MKLRPLVLLSFGLPLLLTGCGDGSAGDGPGGNAAQNTDRRALAEISKGLDEGAYEVRFSGDLQEAEPIEGETLSETTFAPIQRRGTNAEGPYHVSLMTMGLRSGDDEPVQMQIVFALPENVAPGEYPVSASSGDDRVHALVRKANMDWTFPAGIKGTMTIGETGNRFSASWEFTANDREGRTATVEGRAHAIPFRPRSEAGFTRSVNGETEEWEGIANGLMDRGTQVRTIIFGPRDEEVLFDIPHHLEPGSHPLSLGRYGKAPEGTVGVDVRTAGKLHKLDGTFEFQINEETEAYSGRFQLTGSGERKVEVNGEFRHVRLMERGGRR